MARGIAHREWIIWRSDYQTDEEFRQAVETEQALNVHMMERLGVAIIGAPMSEQLGDGRWVRAGYLFQTASVPGKRAEPEVDVEIDEAEDLAGAVGLTDD